MLHISVRYINFPRRKKEESCRLCEAMEIILSLVLPLSIAGRVRLWCFGILLVSSDGDMSASVREDNLADAA